jgi:cyclopropane fatty-acyl-phospholipid synthase-like methyltransferase
VSDWRKIAITLIDRVVSIDACLQEYVRVASLHGKRNTVCKPDGIMAGHVLGTMAHNRMNDNVTQSIRESYDRLADKYARRIFNELQQKPLDRELLSRFAAEIARGGEVCDMGCGPGHVARYLHDAGAAVFGLDISPRMLAQARQLTGSSGWNAGRNLCFLCHRQYSENVSAGGVSGNEESAATGGTAIACISYWRRNSSRG